ncbi:hypothetical protein PACTADRAFT_2694 [Pachysolen tannophilus NRRL Y-2460]|uniref:Uncharacterized protein n=1 Tax=Pachysolen tannophilus NRRL Y-2460 TaxID=669874 RepID=A0A1E4TXF6_PACTA|nr:hypothetical protein PACTADRAFT_2694 [Pachysolen tannophilus NRRL Y-2460]
MSFVWKRAIIPTNLIFKKEAFAVNPIFKRKATTSLLLNHHNYAFLFTSSQPIKTSSSFGVQSVVKTTKVIKLPVIGNRYLSSSRLVQSFYNSPRRNPGAPSAFSRISDVIPDPVKILLLVLGVSSFFFFIALPVLFIALPPILIGGFLTSKMFQRKYNTAMDQRWSALENTSLSFQPSSRNAMADEETELARKVFKRLKLALDDDEGGIYTGFGFRDIQDINHLKLGEIESIRQDMRDVKIQFNSINEVITVMSMGLYDRRNDMRLGTVTVSLKNSAVSTLIDQLSNKKDMIIEVKPLNPFSKSYIINTDRSYGDGDNIIIDVKNFKSWEKK